jgi:hypothetical protein
MEDIRGCSSGAPMARWLTIWPALGFRVVGTAPLVNGAIFGVIDADFSPQRLMRDSSSVTRALTSRTQNRNRRHREVEYLDGVAARIDHRQCPP